MITDTPKLAVITNVSEQMEVSFWTLFPSSGSSEDTSRRKVDDRSVVLQKSRSFNSLLLEKDSYLRAMTNSLVNEAHDTKQRPA